MEYLFSSTSTSNGNNSTSTPSFGTDPLGGHNGPTQLFIIQIIIIILFCRGFAWLFAKIWQPAVIAEIISGILLGPSVIGRIPGFQDTIFPEESLAHLKIFSEIALIFFMSLVGMELDFELMKRKVKYTFFVSFAGIAFPFVLSIGASWSIYNVLESSDNEHSFGIYLLFMGVALSITAFPVLARIIKENQMGTTELGVVALSTAAWDDVAAWILLALSIGLATGGAALNALWSFLLLGGYVAVMFTFGRWALNKVYIVRGKARHMSPFIISSLFLLILANSWLTEYFGLHSIFGAFVFGICLPRTDSFVINIAEKFEDFILCFLLPVYFALSGLKTKIDLINSGNAAGLMLLVICIASVSKIAGAFISAKVVGFTWRESLTLGFLMNCKGLVELIVLNIGLENGIISEQVFTIMVVMAIVTTFITSPAVRLLYPMKKIAMYESKRVGTTTISMFIKHTNHVDKMLRLVSLITQFKPKIFAVYAFHSSGDQERPSTYMTKPENDIVLAYVKETSESYGLQVKSVLVANDSSKTNCAKQLSRAAMSKNTDFLIMYWKIEDEDLENDIIGGYTIERLSHYASSKAIIMVEKQDVSFPRKLKHIVFIYGGTKHDTQAAKVLRKSLQGSSTTSCTIVNIFNPQNHRTKGNRNYLIRSLLKLPNTKLVEVSSASPTTELIEMYSKPQKNSICIIGSEIHWGAPTECGIDYRTLVTEIQRPFLIVSDCSTFSEPENDQVIELGPQESQKDDDTNSHPTTDEDNTATRDHSEAKRSESNETANNESKNEGRSSTDNSSSHISSSSSSNNSSSSNDNEDEDKSSDQHHHENTS